jgi:hypothetical protein
MNYNVLKTIHNLVFNTDNMSINFGENHRGFPWVIMSYVKSNDLKHVFNCWRWNIKQDENNNIVNINFTGQNLGDDFFLFKSIAPFVKTGSFLEFESENNKKWRWIFENNICKEVTPKIIWT